MDVVLCFIEITVVANTRVAFRKVTVPLLQWSSACILKSYVLLYHVLFSSAVFPMSLYDQ